MAAQRFKLSIHSDVSNLNTVADFIAQATQQSGLNERDVYNVQLAVDEAVTNTIRHAYRGRTDGQIDISCARQGSDFIIEIQDFGQPFDASKIPTPRVQGPLSRRTVGGLGIYFMKQLMDKVEFSHSSKHGNRVRIVKRIS